MKFVLRLRDLLYEKNMADIDPNSTNRLKLHKEILERKPLLKNVFKEFHEEIMRLNKKYSRFAEGAAIELGAGVYPIKNSYPHVLATDILPSKDLDGVLDAQKMDVKSGSVRAIYGQNCFHHFPDPAAFFRELERVLVPGGVAILIDPYHGCFASFMYKNLFSSEDFNKNGTWENNADFPNQALSYVVFKRDQKIFAENFPELELVHQEPLSNYLRYLLSGGLNFKSLIPNFMEKPVKLMESALRPVQKNLALHQIIVLRRR